MPRWARWVAAIVVVAGVPVAWYLVSPLFINRVVDEPFPASTDVTVPSGMTRQQVEGQMMAASRTETAASDAMPAGADSGSVVARGAFMGADDFHKGEGTATVHRIGTDLVLRLDPFRVTNGPDLHVLLVKAETPASRADVQAGYVEIAPLKGNIGGQNYTLPAGLRLEDYKTVVIYCKPFHVVFATAPLRRTQ